MTDKTFKNLSQLTQRLKNSDTNYARIVKGIQVMYWVLIPVYIVLTLIHIFDESRLTDILGGSCMVISMLIFALLMRHYYKEYNFVDYSQPTLIMLKKAAYRYQPFQKQAIWALVAILVMGFGLTLNNWEFNPLKTIIPFGILMVVSVIVGLIWWYFRYKPLRDDAMALIRDIEGDLEESEQ